MQILVHELGVGDTVDPLGGSYFVEAMTDEMETRIVGIMAKMEAGGGILRAVAMGQVQAEVNRQAYEAERRLQSGQTKKVGVNCYVEEEGEREIEFHPYRVEEAERQVARLNKIRAERDAAGVERTLAAVKQAAEKGENVMPSILTAVEAYATVGEVCGVLKSVFGEYEEPVRF
jgi:methylmalonyl-CoA mutase N-terminal domain/subunit